MRLKDWETIADNISKTGWSWGCVSAIARIGDSSLRRVVIDGVLHCSFETTAWRAPNLRAANRADDASVMVIVRWQNLYSRSRVIACSRI
jgi:hypothetical protein